MKNIKMPLMAPQLLQDKAPNPNLAFEALHSLVPTAPSSLTSLLPPVAQPQSLGSCSAFSLLPSVLLPGQVPALTWLGTASLSLAPSSHSLYGSQSDHYYT